MQTRPDTVGLAQRREATDMKRSIFPVFAWTLVASLLGGCGDDSTGAVRSPDFSGEWILVSTLAQKMPCLVGELDEIAIEEVHITQEGNLARLDFVDYSVPGEIVDDVLYANGSSAAGRPLSLELTRRAQSLDGNVLLLGDGCHENRSVVARRRIVDADFSGHWEFQLRVIGQDGCEEIVDYNDCFRILQNDGDLLVVDDIGGNLTGRVYGDVAQIQRETEQEKTSLVFYFNADRSQLSGNAIRAFASLGCRSDLVFEGSRSSVPCAQHGS